VVEENVTASSTEESYATFGSSVDESSAVSDTYVAFATFAVQLSESSSGSSQVSAGSALVNATVQETARLSDQFTGSPFWAVIDDTQTANWNNINT
jgi:hypothetical protein